MARSATFRRSAAAVATTDAAAEPLAGAGRSDAIASSRSGVAELLLAPGDELLELLVDRGVDPGVRIFGQHLLPSLGRDDVGRASAEALPAIVVLGRGDPRPVEACSGVAQRVLGAEEVAAGTNLAQRVHRHALLIHGHPTAEDPLEHPQLLDVDAVFILGREQRALQPARGVEDEA